ncbi:hypothetical protein MHYP_G00088670 [Metynnis hypsauchen]
MADDEQPAPSLRPPAAAVSAETAHARVPLRIELPAPFTEGVEHTLMDPHLLDIELVHPGGLSMMMISTFPPMTPTLLLLDDLASLLLTVTMHITGSLPGTTAPLPGFAVKGTLVAPLHQKAIHTHHITRHTHHGALGPSIPALHHLTQNTNTQKPPLHPLHHQCHMSGHIAHITIPPHDEFTFPHRRGKFPICL